MDIVNKFLEWIKLKERLHQSNHEPPFFKEGEVWWASFGENIGVEINGKSRDFTRPVLVFRKLSRDSFVGLPVSTQYKQGTWFVSVNIQNKNQTIILNQIRTLSSKRLHSKVGELNDTDCKSVAKGFINLYILSNKKYPPPL